MQQYKVANEAGLITSDEAPHAVGDVITLDETAQQTLDWQAAGDIVLVEAAPADAPVGPAPTLLPFQIEVTYNPSATDDDKNATLDWVKSMTDGLTAGEPNIPACVDTVTVRRTQD